MRARRVEHDLFRKSKSGFARDGQGLLAVSRLAITIHNCEAPGVKEKEEKLNNERRFTIGQSVSLHEQKESAGDGPGPMLAMNSALQSGSIFGHVPMSLWLKDAGIVVLACVIAIAAIITIQCAWFVVSLRAVEDSMPCDRR
jgi:hypothetical protein